MPEPTLVGTHGRAWSVAIRPSKPDELATVALWIVDADDGDEKGRWLVRLRHLDESRWPAGAGHPGRRGPQDTHEVSVVALADDDEIGEHKLPVPGWRRRDFLGLAEQFDAADDAVAREIALTIVQALVDAEPPADRDFRKAWRRVVADKATDRRAARAGRNNR